MAAYTAIDDPSAYFKVQLWTGDGVAIGSGGQAIVFDDTDTDMQPDLVWIKERSSTSGHQLVDAVRGVTKHLESEDNGAESDQTEGLTAFGSDGFTVGENGAVNQDTQTYVAWCWKESATAGFDIVSYTGNGSNRTIAHSLSATPDLVIIKKRNDTGNWMVGGSTTLGGDNKLLLMDTTAALDDNSEVYQSFSSSTFGIGVNAYTNANTDTFIAYCFSGKQGFSKFGSYTGNGNADGTFVYIGFRPAYVMIKRTDSTDNWQILDNERAPYNLMQKTLYADVTTAEETTDRLDFLSNGFKIRATNAAVNASGGTYIYMAFAEAPFVNSNGVPCNAR